MEPPPYPPYTGPLVEKELGRLILDVPRFAACMFGAAAPLEFLCRSPFCELVCAVLVSENMAVGAYVVFQYVQLSLYSLQMICQELQVCTGVFFVPSPSSIDAINCAVEHLPRCGVVLVSPCVVAGHQSTQTPKSFERKATVEPVVRMLPKL